VSRYARSLIILLAVVGIVAAACSPSSGALGSPATPPPTTASSVEAPSDDATPDLSSPAPTTAPSATAEPTPSAPATEPASSKPTSKPSPTPAPTKAPADTTIVRAYFFLGSFSGNAGLAPVLREIPRTSAVATAAIHALLDGPNDAELGARPAMYTDIPDGTRLLDLSIKDGVATIDLSAEFEAGGGKASILGRLAQVVYTLTQFPTVDGVLFKLDGKPVTVFGGAGVSLDHPVGREDYTDQLPAIFVDRPAWGAAFGHPGRVSGLANVFEATFRVRLLDAKGSVLADRQVMASCGTGCWGSFRVDLSYTVTKGQYGTLRVYDRSAKGGTPENVTEYPVWLTPEG
jgi:spore germination protein GerM